MRKQWIMFTVLTVAIAITGTVGPSMGNRRAGGVAGYVNSFSPQSMRWGLKEIKAPEAWEVTKGSNEVVVAVIDSGIDRTIPEINRNLWKNEDEVPGDNVDNDKNGYVDDVHGWDFRDNDNDPLTDDQLYYHGTFVAGLIASTVKDRNGMAGVAPEVNIMDLKFLDSKGSFYTSDWGKLVESINYAVNNGADIINLSIDASLRPPKSVHDAMKRASKKGVLIVGVAGNDGTSVGHFGKWNTVMAVGAVDDALRPASFSNSGSQIEVSAPGVKVLSYLPNGRLATASGTSFAAPHVSGIAALIKSRNPEMTGEDMRGLIQFYAMDIYKEGWDKKTGGGIVDAHSVVRGASL